MALFASEEGVPIWQGPDELHLHVATEGWSVAVHRFTSHAMQMNSPSVVVSEYMSEGRIRLQVPQ